MDYAYYSPSDPSSSTSCQKQHVGYDHYMADDHLWQTHLYAAQDHAYAVYACSSPMYQDGTSYVPSRGELVHLQSPTHSPLDRCPTTSSTVSSYSASSIAMSLTTLPSDSLSAYSPCDRIADAPSLSFPAAYYDAHVADVLPLYAYPPLSSQDGLGTLDHHLPPYSVQTNSSWLPHLPADLGGAPLSQLSSSQPYSDVHAIDYALSSIPPSGLAHYGYSDSACMADPPPPSIPEPAPQSDPPESLTLHHPRPVRLIPAASWQSKLEAEENLRALEDAASEQRVSPASCQQWARTAQSSCDTAAGGSHAGLPGFESTDEPVVGPSIGLGSRRPSLGSSSLLLQPVADSVMLEHSQYLDVMPQQAFSWQPPAEVHMAGPHFYSAPAQTYLQV